MASAADHILAGRDDAVSFPSRPIRDSNALKIGKTMRGSLPKQLYFVLPVRQY